MFPARSAAAMWQWVAPRSAARTTPTSGFMVNTTGLRPPVDGPLPDSIIKPVFRISSTRRDTVERDRPARRARSARLTWRCCATSPTRSA